jgi:carbonic anhydrase
VHGWIYGLRDGLMRDLGMTVDQAADIETQYAAALNKLF